MSTFLGKILYFEIRTTVNNLPESAESFGELIDVQLLVSVVVESAEDDLHGAEAEPSFLLDLHFEVGVDPAHLDIEAYAKE
jgi:hypothetical protein